MSAMGHPMTIVTEARALVAAGWPAQTASRILKERHDVYVSGRTILAWTNPAQAKRDRDRRRRFDAHRSREQANFRLSSDAPAYKEAFVERLREAGVPRSSIAKVCGVVFGEPWTRHRVVKILEGASS